MFPRLRHFLLSLLSCLVLFPIHLQGGNVDGVRISGSPTGDLYLTETEDRILFGNADIEFLFDKAHGGILIEIRLHHAPTTFAALEHQIQGQWSVETTAHGRQSPAQNTYEGGECLFEENEAILRLHSATPAGRLTHTYRLKTGARSLILGCQFSNTSESPDILKNFRFTVENLAIGGFIENNEYIYPPTWLHFMKGSLQEATPQQMNARYVYGSHQPTDKMMLPYAMIFDSVSGDAIALAGVNSRAKVFVGVEGGDSGKLETRFDFYRTLAPEETLEAGTAYLSVWSGGWQQAMQAEKELLMEEAGFRAPKMLPDFVKDLVIVWHGIPGVEVQNYRDLGERLKNLRDAGANAVIVGGKLWLCPASNNAQGTIFDYIPIPKNGEVVPAPDIGGLAGFRELVATAHALDMKLFTWGPVSMAGISRESAEATSEPDWWIYQEDGSFNDWYHFMAPANPHSQGWQEFVLRNVKKLILDYGVDGIWLDSSWQDHQLNHRATDGWQGAPNGGKLALIDQIVEVAKTADPNCVVMAETSGAEFMSRVDIAYLQVHGIWPAVPPEGIQEMLIAQEINRLPGVRPFGQIELGTGFYPELADEAPQRIARDHAESWVAKSFLISTLDRIPVYFGLSWGIDRLFLPDATAPEHVAFRKWFEMFKKVNQVRADHREIIEGETRFDSLETSSPSVVHYLRKTADAASLILLNADKTEQAVQVRLTSPEPLGIQPTQKYQIRNLMRDENIPSPSGSAWDGATLLREGFPLILAGYEGAIVKIMAVSENADSL